MWQSEESIQLIETVERYMAKTYPIESINDNHEFSGNLLDIIHDWNLVSAGILKRSGDECKQQWHHLVRQYLFITDHINTESGGPAVFTIDWRSMEQMRFLPIYMNNYKRYERPIIEDTETERTTETETALDSETVLHWKPALEELKLSSEELKQSSEELKQIVEEILWSKPQPEYAIKLKSNADSVYGRETVGYCEVASMIEDKMENWPQSEKTRFLMWYYEYLVQILRGYSVPNIFRR